MQLLFLFCISFLSFQPFKRQPHKMYSNNYRRQITDELFECVWRFCGVGG